MAQLTDALPDFMDRHPECAISHCQGFVNKVAGQAHLLRLGKDGFQGLAGDTEGQGRDVRQHLSRRVEEGHGLQEP